MDADQHRPSATSESGQDSDGKELETKAHRPSSRGALEVRCPNCRASMDVAVDTQFTDLTCNSCGSHFSLVDQGQATRMAPPLSKMGRFELIERIGVGGFGSVWKARDKELDRTVAVKIPRQGGMTSEEQEKFFREARAAAQLRHPSIVSVHEVGRDGDSVYIVSDFVRGVTLGDWLTGQQLTSREAAELCAKIADALEHAHEKGVVHRDLKPANIMMDGDGQPHLMDFGLARRDVGEVTVTMDGQVLGTPAYMSPEQAEGKGHSADRRSDVYSLGVILFQLLTGELPFRGNARMLMHQVINDEPPSPRKLNANVAKDLETITLKCLEKDLSRRYQSAANLGAELNRFLAGEPILARPLGGIERSWRWVKRNRRVAALTTSVAVLLVAIAALSLVGFAVAKKQQIAAQDAAAREFNLRGQAERNLDLAEAAVATYLTRVAEDNRLKQGDFNKLRTELLQSAVPFYEQFAKQKPGEAKSETNQANAYARLASIHGDIGKPDLSAHEYEQAIAIQKRLVEKYPDTPWYQRDLANHEVELGWNLHVVGKYDEAHPHYEAALSILSTLAARFPNEPDHRYKLARAHERFGMLLRNSDIKAAREQFEHAINLEKALLASAPNSSEFQSALASSSFYLGVLYVNSSLNEPELAQKYLKTAVDIQRKLTSVDPKNPEYRAALAESLEFLGRALGSLNDRDTATRHFEEGIDIQKQVVAEFPSVVKYRIILAAMHSNFANFLNVAGDKTKAFQQYELFAEVREKQAADFPDVGNATQIAVNAHSHCVMLAQQRGDKAAAEKHQNSIKAIWARRVADAPNDYNAMRSYALILINPPNPSPDDAKRAVEIAKKACELTNYQNAGMVETLGTATWSAGDLDAAMNHFKQAIALYERALTGAPHDRQHRANLAYAHWRIAGCLWQFHDMPAICDHHQKALELFQKLMADFPDDNHYVDCVVSTHQYLGDAFDQRQDFPTALKHRERALKLYDAHLTSTAKNLGDLFRTALGFDQRRNGLLQALNNTKARQRGQKVAKTENQNVVAPTNNALKLDPPPVQPTAPVPNESDPLADPLRLAE